MNPTPTDILVAGTALVWLLFDIFVGFVRPSLGIPTITRRIQAVSAAYPVIPFAAGCLCGHLFGRF